MNNPNQQKLFDLKKRRIKRRRRYFDNIILKRKAEKKSIQFHSKIHRLLGSHSLLENTGILGMGLLIFLSFIILNPLIAKAEVTPVTTESHFSQNSEPEFILKTKGSIKTTEAMTSENELLVKRSKISVGINYRGEPTDIVSEILVLINFFNNIGSGFVFKKSPRSSWSIISSIFSTTVSNIAYKISFLLLKY